MALFRYIHISDTHFCVEPGRQHALILMRRRPRELIDTTYAQLGSFGFSSLARPASFVPDIISGVAQFCFERREVIDGIIFTGDLATTGQINDIGVAYSFISDLPSRGFVTDAGSPAINLPNVPIYLLPGNHDKYLDNKGGPNCKNFELKFASYLRNFSSGVCHWVRRKQERSLGLISADFCLHSRNDARDKVIGVFGQGRVYQHVLDELQARTLALRSRHREIELIWLIHFAPFDCGYNLELIDYSDIADTASRLRVTATLCGHTHKASKFTREDHSVCCAGSAGCVDSERDSRVQIIQIDLGEKCMVSRDNYLWDASSHEFKFKNKD